MKRTGKIVRWNADTYFKSVGEQIHDHMKCQVCQDLVHAPMFCNCCELSCESAASHGLICFKCMYSFLQMDKCVRTRCKSVPSWSPYCTQHCQFALPFATLSNTRHTFHPFYDRIRDQIGPSVCFACHQDFKTTTALRHHLEICQNLITCCPSCDFRGDRLKVSKHFRDEHETIQCPTCSNIIKVGMWKYHIYDHINTLKTSCVTTQSGNWKVFPSGICNRNF